MTLEAKDRNLLKRVLTKVKNFDEFLRDYYNLNIDALNNMLFYLTLTKNFNSQLVQDVTIGAGDTVKVGHKLGVIPSYKIVVKQSGGGLIRDGEYTKNSIELENSGGTDAVISVIIFKE